MDFLIHWPPGPVVATVQCQGLTFSEYVWCSRKTMHIAKKICCFIVDSECSTISQNKTVYIIKIFQPELDLQNF